MKLTIKEINYFRAMLNQACVARIRLSDFRHDIRCVWSLIYYGWQGTGNYEPKEKK